jgi:hypothetical protein
MTVSKGSTQMNFKPFRISVGMGITALLFSMGCGGGGSSSSNSTPVTPAATTGTVNVLVSDDATQDWATVGVKVLSISLVPTGGGTPVPVYTAPSPTPVINLVQLDQLSEIIGNAAVPFGSYSSAILTLSANPGDVTLISSADPEANFDVAPSTQVPSSNIQIKGATGGAGSLTVPLTVQLAQNLAVTATSTNALDLEFDLKHPAFIVEHKSPSGPANSISILWAINFNGPVRHHPLHDLSRLILRHTLGQITAVSTDNSAITITKDYATYPAPNPQVPIVSTVSLNIPADATNGTIFYDVDANTKTVIKDFSTVSASLLNNGTGKYVRIAARYQSNGSLVAVRIWASSTFQKVWLSPEGHVLHVNTANNVMTVSDENGNPVAINIGAGTQFYFRAPQNALADATAIGTGTSFFDGITPGNLPNLARGFKVHVSVVDPLASAFTADTVDIEIARYDGVITGANTSGFMYTRIFSTAPKFNDNYTGTLDYIANSTANGTDSNGTAITGFDWWNFTFPTLADTGTTAIPDFVTVANNSANFGSTVSSKQNVWGVSYSNWGDGTTANATNWFAKFAVIEPTQFPSGTVSSPFAIGPPAATNGATFGMTVPNEPNTVMVDLSTVHGSAALVYAVDNTNKVVTITPQDITNSTVLASVQTAINIPNTPVKVFGVPTLNGAIQAYVLFYYTGTLPQ